MVGQNNIVPVNNVVIQGGQVMQGGISQGSRVLVQSQQQAPLKGQYIMNTSNKVIHNGHINFQTSSPVSPRILPSHSVQQIVTPTRIINSS
jgi:hypothetical protein